MTADRSFTLQWHLTTKCEFNCVFCYINDEERRNEARDTMSFEDAMKVLKDFKQSVDHWRAKGFIYFSGGNPLLCDYFWLLLEESVNMGIGVSILGNPTAKDSDLKKLADFGLRNFQISIEGLEGIHDTMRGNGHFDMTMKFLKKLRDYGISRHIMFTLSKTNASDLLPLMKYLAENDLADVFGFARLVPIGKGVNTDLVNTDEYKKILLAAIEESIRWRRNNYSISLSKKEGELFYPLLAELGISEEMVFSEPEPDEICDGCYIGWTGLTLLHNGTVYPCRRLPVDIGKVPEQSIREIFVKNELLDKFRNLSSFEKCSRCKYRNWCRGCPAVASALTGNPFAPDPNCWIKINGGEEE